MVDKVVEKTWEHGGYPCQVNAEMGYRYGYVGIPKGHPSYGKDFRDVDVDVHGGLIYSGDNPDSDLEDVWWLGFNCAHYGDLPDPQYTPQGFIHAQALSGGNHVWSLQEAMEETERMADQLIEAAEG